MNFLAGVGHGNESVNRRTTLYRKVFFLAGIYNMAWGLLTVFYPQWFFDFVSLPHINHPAFVACLGMAIGLYGILYVHVSTSLADGFLIILVGFTGKILGPLGVLYLVLTGTWPISSVVLIITNDLLWLPFFALYLLDYRPQRSLT